MDLISAPPKSRQIANRLRDQIVSGQLEPGSRVHSIRSLADRYDVSPSVIQRSYAILEDDGLIVREAGRGTFVRRGATHTTFGLLTTAIPGSYDNYYESLQEVTAEQHSLFLPIGSRDSADPDRVRRLLGFVAEHRIHALLFDGLAQGSSPSEIRQLVRDTPVCVVHRWQWDEPIAGPAVLVDFAAAYREALVRLRDLGHRRVVIGVFHNFQKRFVRRRLDKAFKDGNAPFTGRDLHLLNVDKAARRPATLARLFGGRRPPTAALCMTDVLCHRLREVLDSSGARACPLTMVGFYDTPWSQHAGGEFSSFRVDFRTMWEHAIGMMNHDRTSTEVAWVPPRFVDRTPGGGDA